MKNPHRLGLVVGGVLAILLVLAGVAAFSLLRPGSGVLAFALAVAFAAAAVAVGVAWSLAREAEEEIGQILPPAPVETLPLPTPKRGFKVREARPGEVPDAYLAAVRRGAQARRDAWKESARHH